MISQFFDFARKVDDTLRRRLGRPYHAALGVGLIIEIAKSMREAPHWGERADGLFRAAAAIALFAMLLLHQIAELGAHFERRRQAPRD